MAAGNYVIRGGIEGRERLRMLSRVMRHTTLLLLARIGIPRDASCLDVGCGGGDVTLELARHVSLGGRVVGIDLDEVELQLARMEAKEQSVSNVEYRTADACGPIGNADFEVVYARFLLSHLNDPAACIRSMLTALKPGGLLILEDTDMSGLRCYPDSAAFNRFRELYTQAIQAYGADPDIGFRLPILLLDAGLERVGINVVQPAGLAGEVKLLPPLTMEYIAERVLAAGLATSDELNELVDQMYEFARDTRTVVAIPRAVQAWGYRAG